MRHRKQLACGRPFGQVCYQRCCFGTWEKRENCRRSQYTHLQLEVSMHLGRQLTGNGLIGRTTVTAIPKACDAKLDDLKRLGSFSTLLVDIILSRSMIFDCVSVPDSGHLKVDGDIVGIGDLLNYGRKLPPKV